MDRPATQRVRVKRVNELARYDRDTLDAILAAMPMCHVGYVFDGRPYVTPTLQWRIGDHIYWHGSAASRMLEAVEGQPVCLTVSLFDGLVLARSAFNFTENYRSAMLLGTARVVAEPAEKTEALQALMEILVAGHWDQLRPMRSQELKATTVVSMPIEEFSIKLRDGHTIDDDEDYTFPVWAGLVPIRTVMGAPEADPRNLEGVVAPPGLAGFGVG
jgi:nitroimidazol reductase NimA-like FMN-containing flavoprotein (pyridoxamine 5'-phosphate oxidase superfamily)